MHLYFKIFNGYSYVLCIEIRVTITHTMLHRVCRRPKSFIIHRIDTCLPYIVYKTD